MGYSRAGFDVVGVDIEAQPLYPFEHQIGDALAFLEANGNEFDAVHGSPPCQKFITGGLVKGRADRPDLLTPMRELMIKLGKPWIIENVPGAPMRADAMLCGSMFGLTLRRHRLFETSFGPVLTPSCNHRGKVCGVYGHMHGKRGGWVNAKGVSTMMPSTLENWRTSIGAPWMDAAGLAQSIPPDYTEFMGRALLRSMA